MAPAPGGDGQTGGPGQRLCTVQRRSHWRKKRSQPGGRCRTAGCRARGQAGNRATQAMTGARSTGLRASPSRSWEAGPRPRPGPSACCGNRGRCPRPVRGADSRQSAHRPQLEQPATADLPSPPESHPATLRAPARPMRATRLGNPPFLGVAIGSRCPRSPRLARGAPRRTVHARKDNARPEGTTHAENAVAGLAPTERPGAAGTADTTADGRPTRPAYDGRYEAGYDGRPR